MMYTRFIGGFGRLCSGLWLGHSWVGIGLAVLFVAAIVVVVVLSSKGKKSKANDEAADALKLRYVKGEITEEEYQKMKDVLGK